MRVCVLGLALAMAASAETNGKLKEILSRISEEAEVFLQFAPQVLAEETLQQRARKAPPRFRPRVGAAALEPPKPEFRTREIVSEYGFSSLRDSPNVLHEFRQVISVDGRKVISLEKARESLSLGMRSPDDTVKKRLLLDFEKRGLIGAVSDFGQLILLFTKRRLPDYQFELSGGARLGADPMLAVAFRQTTGHEALTIFEGRQAIRRPLQGEVWVRAADLLPLQIKMNSVRDDDSYSLRDEAIVEYAPTAHGVLLPVSVTHRQFSNNELMAENVFRYTQFRKFAAESEIKF